MIQKGDVAPNFASVDENEDSLNLADFAGKNNVVLYFYPKDDTPGCTIEANQFTALIGEYDALDTVVIGVSKDTCASHRQFIDKFKLRVRLMSDTSGEVCQTYGVWQEREKDGVKTMGIVRSTFVIDKAGKLAYSEYGVNPDGHADRMLKLIRSL